MDPTATQSDQRKEEPALELRWQRLTDDSGATCDRCGLTETALQEAANRLRRVLAPHDLQVRMRASEIDAAEFLDAPESSNRVWIDGEALEDLLGAEVGMSECVDCGDLCGESTECRALQVGERTYDAIPADLIVEAGLIAASRRLDDERPGLGLTYCVE